MSTVALEKAAPAGYEWVERDPRNPRPLGGVLHRSGQHVAEGIHRIRVHDNIPGA